MGEHNLLNPGFVGPLVNIHTGDTFYFPNFRASGGQLPGLPSLSYPRRDNVCSLPWASSEPCNGYPQPYLSSPVSINPSFGRACDLARVEESKCYYRETCSEPSGLKREERGRDSALLPLETSLPNGMGGNFSKYDYPSSEAVPHDPPSCQSLESDSSSSLLNEGNKGTTGEAGGLVSPLNQGSTLGSGGKTREGGSRGWIWSWFWEGVEGFCSETCRLGAPSWCNSWAQGWEAACLCVQRPLGVAPKSLMFY